LGFVSADFRLYFLSILSEWATRSSLGQGADVNVGCPPWHYSISNLPEPNAPDVMTPTPSVLIGCAVNFWCLRENGLYGRKTRWCLRPWGLVLGFVLVSLWGSAALRWEAAVKCGTSWPENTTNRNNLDVPWPKLVMWKVKSTQCVGGGAAVKFGRRWRTNPAGGSSPVVRGLCRCGDR
jgi:hypothetical protein